MFAALASTPDCAAIDPAGLEPVAEEIGMACERLLDDGAPELASATLAWNLELAARRHGDTIDVVLARRTRTACRVQSRDGLRGVGRLRRARTSRS